MERVKYRMYNGRQPAYYNPAVEHSSVRVPWLELPPRVLERIFTFVCPHASDETYENCESSAIEDACMLCDLRDLAHAGSVCRAWRRSAVKVMYHSIRIDSVHYCEREIDLSEKRKRKTRFDKNGAPEDPAGARLRLLCRTLRDDPTRLGVLVQYFKTPYMIREAKSGDLARTLAVLPNLKYVDLPEGLYHDDPSYHTLRLEVQARCRDFRKMTFNGGSEASLEALSFGNIWTNLEVLELGRIQMDPTKLRYTLAMLPKLRALKVSESRILDDDIFMYNDVLPAFPALEELILKNVPRLTANGLVEYLSRHDSQESLRFLFLEATGVHPATLHEVLAVANRLETLSVVEQVELGFPAQSTPTPPLTNWALRTLRYEITAAPGVGPYASVTTGYYHYLANSLFAGGMPMLSAVYVRDQTFPDLLIGLPPPVPGFGGAGQRPSSSSSMKLFNGGGFGGSPGSPGSPPKSFGLSPPSKAQQQRFSSNNPFAAPAPPFGGRGGAGGGGGSGGFPGGPPMLSLSQPLEIYTKGEDDFDWATTRMDPIDAGGSRGRGRRGHNRSASSTSGRPMSSYGLADIGQGWSNGGGARMSIVVGNGAGGFLAVPGGGGDNAAAANGRRGSATSHMGPGGAAGTSPGRGGAAAGEDFWPRPTSSSGGKGRKDLWR
ncbi:hypothetical protein Micbo1qcDRAFT_160359 [Microdochium bolleyi]|uniref:Uncharacterized protein n=1 Tax=Microdochium bolleyi TaxID=196109 RepID=A0A136J656_9PEZI|nr:hypothetical protein Micbo1qcDRAFT_160359 [Microdochium bolleyi]